MNIADSSRISLAFPPNKRQPSSIVPIKIKVSLERHKKNESDK